MTWNNEVIFVVFQLDESRYQRKSLVIALFRQFVNIKITEQQIAAELLLKLI